jgi:hypothetical protein
MMMIFFHERSFSKNVSKLLVSPPKNSEKNTKVFSQKFLNIVDPLKQNNNLRCSVSKCLCSTSKLLFLCAQPCTDSVVIDRILFNSHIKLIVNLSTSYKDLNCPQEKKSWFTCFCQVCILVLMIIQKHFEVFNHAKVVSFDDLWFDGHSFIPSIFLHGHTIYSPCAWL